ncbi:MAG: SAM-dependent methyltransferase, partial [Halodesulfurarchaeum sp.]
MKRTLDEHAARFDEAAPEYDEDKSEEHRAAVSLVVKHADPAPTETATADGGALPDSPTAR